MKSIQEQATNKITLAGKLLDATFGDGKLADGRYYERATVTIRVTQTYNGREETSEIPVSMFAAQYTNANKPNPAYKQIQDLKNMKTVQNYGFDEADMVRISGAQLQENNFVTKSGQLIDGWQIRSSFVNTGAKSDVATFAIDIFILDMHDELDREGDPTGHLIVKGGIVQYGGKLDVVEFVAEAPDVVDYIERNWNVNDTLQARGRIRVTSEEVKPAASSSGWGEDIPETTTRFVRKLVITSGDDQGREEDFAYDPNDIRKAFNVRKANIEQLQVNASQKSVPKKEEKASKYSWE